MKLIDAGVFLPNLCETQSKNPMRTKAEIKSSGINPVVLSDAPSISPISSADLLGSPVMPPSY